VLDVLQVGAGLCVALDHRLLDSSGVYGIG
jgi:hypothetical protein